MKLWILAALIAVMTVTAYSRVVKAVTGNQLIEYCRAGDESRDQPICLGYILGAAEGINLFANNALATQPYCFPDGVTADQVVNIVLNFSEAHPEDLHLTASFSVLGALTEAWPCD